MSCGEVGGCRRQQEGQNWTVCGLDICMALELGHLQKCGHVQVCLRDTIGSVVEMVAADANKKGLNIAYTMDEMLLRRAVLGDAIRIRQVGAESQAFICSVMIG